MRFPIISFIVQKGEKIGCYYIGRLDNSEGKIFDQLQPKARGSQPLSFKVGTGRVIRGWDEALLKMVVGETAAVTLRIRNIFFYFYVRNYWLISWNIL